MTVRTQKERVANYVDSRRNTECVDRLARFSREIEWFDPCIADAITNWAAGHEHGLMLSEVESTLDQDKRLKPFHECDAELIVFPDRVEICGIQVWSDRGYPDLREVLLILSRKSGGRYVHISGPTLMKQLDRDASNPISTPIKNFCDRASELLALHRGLDCGRYDIIDSQNGYHFREFLRVVIADSNTSNGEVQEPDVPTADPFIEYPPDQAVRLRRICEALGRDSMRNAEIRRLTGVSRAQTTRDLQALSDAGLLAKSGRTYERRYGLTEKAQTLMKPSASL